MLKLSDIACARPGITLCLVALLTMAALSGIRKMEVNADTRAYFSEENKHLNQLRAFEDIYRPNNNILFVIDTKGKDAFDPEILDIVLKITERGWELPHAIQVDSLTNYPHTYSQEDDFILEDLVPGLDLLSDGELDARRASALSDPFLLNRLISDDGKTTAVNVNFSLPSRGSAAVKEINQAASALASEIRAGHPDINILMTGNVVLMRAFTNAALNDVIHVLPISGFGIAVLVFIVLRSWRETLAVVTTVILSAGASFGLGAWAGLNLDQSTAVAPIIIMTLSMAGALHVVNLARRERMAGKPSNTAIADALRHNLSPIALTSLTTFVGFLAFNFADAPPFRDLGNLVAVGIVVSFLMTFTTLPALLHLTGIKSSLPLASGVTNWIGRLAVSQAKTFVVLGPLFVMLVSLGITRISLDDDFIRYFGPKYEYRVASDFAEDNLTGLNVLEFSISSGMADGVYDPAYQRHLADFTSWLKKQPKVVSALSIEDITYKIDTSLNPGKIENWQVPDDRELIAQYFLLYELSLPSGKDITDQIDVDRSASRVNILLRKASSSDIRILKTRAEEWLSNQSPGSQISEGTSINVLFAYLSMVNIEQMLEGTFISFLIISLIIALALRKMSYGFASLITNMLPAFAGFGIWGLMIGQINLAASVITAMTLGIVVDDTIHYLHNYRLKRESGLDAKSAVRATTDTVGMALLMTTFSLSMGFALLALSDFQVNQTLGIFTALILLIAVVIDLLILPSVLIRFDGLLHKMHKPPQRTNQTGHKFP
ncbi:MAG: hypothetical protein EP347_02230 [Alphaproteobacteria bacterium]|nr:MAG: hypothetical protein EP347_02230 [Alphaproteobacteria bacterium]